MFIIEEQDFKEFKEFLIKVKDDIALITEGKVKTDISSMLQNNRIKQESLGVYYSSGNGIRVKAKDLYQYFYEQGGDTDAIAYCAVMILDLLDKNVERVDEMQEKVQSAIADYEKAKPMLRLRLVNGKLNQRKLSTHPHIPFLDLEIMFYLEIDRYEEATGNLAVSNDLFAKWGVNLEQMYQDALANMQQEIPATLQKMRDILKSIIPDGAIKETDILHPELYVLSNERGMYGAASILYPETLEGCAKTIGGDLIIIPSSVHEFIVYLGDAVVADPEQRSNIAGNLDAMIQSVNENDVEPEDILSDHAYFYSAKEKTIKMQPPF